MKFTIEFLAKLNEAFSQDTQVAVVQVVKNVAFEFYSDFGSAEVWRLLLVLDAGGYELARQSAKPALIKRG